MTYLVLVWTTVTCLCWTSGSAQVLAQQNPRIHYPKIHSNETLVCECHLDPCDLFLWFRSREDGKLQFLVSVNNAERITHNKEDKDHSRFKAGMNNAKSTLRITKVTREDSGTYSCVSKAKKTEAVWKPGVLLLPGVTPPTAPPKPKPTEPVCMCRKKGHKPQPKGCSSVLWPMVGILVGLAMALLSTLYYFSRLPKKCRHHFVKKGPMRRI